MGTFASAASAAASRIGGGKSPAECDIVVDDIH